MSRNSEDQRANLRPLLAWAAVVAGVAVLLQLAGGPEAWRVERGLAAAEPWRLLAAHLVHVGWVHLGLNLAGLALVFALVGTALGPGQWTFVFLCCVLGIDLGLLLLSPGIEWYAGLSGVLHGLLAAGALAALGRSPVTGGLLLGGLALKLWLEQAGSPGPGTALIGAPVVAEAHLYGTLAGAGAWLVLSPCRSRSSAARR